MPAADNYLNGARSREPILNFLKATDFCPKLIYLDYLKVVVHTRKFDEVLLVDVIWLKKVSQKWKKQFHDGLKRIVLVNNIADIFGKLSS